MKKLVTFLLLTLFAVNLLHAQTTESLTNSTIIKMVKGKLSDDLIIDEINSSKVNFDLSDESVKTLMAGNVSDQVIQAMKAANETQNPTPPTEIIVPAAVATTAVIPLTQDEAAVQPEIIPLKDTLAQPETEVPVLSLKDTIVAPATSQVAEAIIQPEKEPIIIETAPSKALSVENTKSESGTTIVIEKPALTIEAISYVIPVTELIPFYNKEFSSLTDAIKEWDKKTRASLEKEKQTLDAIAKTEKELTDKKNASAKQFTKDIIDQNNTLVQSWGTHKSIKIEMITEEKKLIEELKKISVETDNAIDAKFKEVIKNVKSANPDPSKGETAKSINIPKQKFNSKVTNHFAPVAMMLVCYQNEIISLQDVIAAWNEKALNSIQKDSELKKQLDPLQDELTQYTATSKQNQKLKKKEISALKKQCDNLEKERKQLAKQMGTDSEKLAEDLNKVKAEVQGVVKQRFTDIIENVEHSYQEKYNL